MQLSDLAALLGSTFTGISVLFALIVYKRGEDKQMFSRFRLVLIDLQHNIRRIDRALSEGTFSEIGENITTEIKKIIQKDSTCNDVINYLKNEGNHDYIATAIHLGRNKTKKIEYINDLTELIERVPFEYQEQLPVVSAITNNLISYVNIVARQTISPSIFNQILGSPNAIEKLVIPNVEGIDDVDTLFQRISLIISAACSSALETRGQPMFDRSEELLNLLIGTYANMSDAKLRIDSKLQRSKSNELTKIESNKPIEEAFRALQLVRNQFSHSEWDQIVETKTTLFQLAHGDDGN